MTGLLFGTVTAATADTVTVDVAGSEWVLDWPGTLAASVGQVLWLVRRGRRLAIVGQAAASLYDNPRAYSAPIAYDGM